VVALNKIQELAQALIMDVWLTTILKMTIREVAISNKINCRFNKEANHQIRYLNLLNKQWQEMVPNQHLEKHNTLTMKIIKMGQIKIKAQMPNQLIQLLTPKTLLALDLDEYQYF